MHEELNALLSDVLMSFNDARAQPFQGHAWPRWFESASKRALGDFASSHNLRLTTGSGKGTWPEIPWVGLGHKRLAQKWQKGLYVTFLFNAGLDGFALSLQQGMTEIREAVGMRRCRPILRERAAAIREQTKIPPIFRNETLDLGASDRRGRMYQVAHVCGRSYPADLAERLNAGRDLEELVNYYISLAEVDEIVELVNATPRLEDGHPEIARDSTTLLDHQFERKYRKLIAELADHAREEGDSVVGGTKRKATLAMRRLGQEALRKALLTLYEPRCAACGDVVVIADRGTRARRFSLHAAHVVGIEFGGITRVYNGLLLCPNHHWGFDNLCWWIEDDLTIHVAEPFRAQAWFGGLHGRRLADPIHEAAALRPEAIRHHRRRAKKHEHPSTSSP